MSQTMLQNFFNQIYSSEHFLSLYVACSSSCSYTYSNFISNFKTLSLFSCWYWKHHSTDFQSSFFYNYFVRFLVLVVWGSYTFDPEIWLLSMMIIGLQFEIALSTMAGRSRIFFVIHFHCVISFSWRLSLLHHFFAF